MYGKYSAYNYVDVYASSLALQFVAIIYYVCDLEQIRFLAQLKKDQNIVLELLKVQS
jgi:hypothetical protein